MQHTQHHHSCSLELTASPVDQHLEQILTQHRLTAELIQSGVAAWKSAGAHLVQYPHSTTQRAAEIHLRIAPTFVRIALRVLRPVLSFQIVWAQSRTQASWRGSARVPFGVAEANVAERLEACVVQAVGSQVVQKVLAAPPETSVNMVLRDSAGTVGLI